MADNDKLAGTLKVARADRKGAQLRLERPVGTLNTVAMRLVVSGKMAGQARRQFHSAAFTGPETVSLPDDFLPSAAEGWVQVTFAVADPAGAGAKFVQKGALVLPSGQQEPLWDDFNLSAGAVADFINLTWTVTE
jgi:hypothetical protein